MHAQCQARGHTRVQALLAREFEKLDTAVRKCKDFGITGTPVYFQATYH